MTEDDSDLIAAGEDIYLSLLLTYEWPLESRMKRLEDEYRIGMNDELKKEMSTVCNLGEGIARWSREEGREEGRAEGETRLALLMKSLIALGRLDDATRCTTDEDYRKKLYQEFKIS